MRLATIAAAGLAALLIPEAGRAQLVRYEDAANQGIALARPTGGLMQNQQLKTTMDRVFGPGQWRETSGYRTPAEEDELRREGAGTVPIGVTSHHSMGTPDAPGAYDLVVAGMSTESAAERLKGSSDDFSRVFAEGAHGRQGQHLHVEPRAGRFKAATTDVSADDPSEHVYLRVVGGRRNPALAGSP